MRIGGIFNQFIQIRTNQMKKIISILAITLASFARADYKDTSNIKIELISVWTASGDILVQTKPIHSIQGLACTSDYWLKLSETAAGYDGTLSMLLSAQATQATVTVRAYDDQGTDFCKLGGLSG